MRPRSLSPEATDETPLLELLEPPSQGKQRPLILRSWGSILGLVAIITLYLGLFVLHRENINNLEEIVASRRSMLEVSKAAVALSEQQLQVHDATEGLWRELKGVAEDERDCRRHEEELEQCHGVNENLQRLNEHLQAELQRKLFGDLRSTMLAVGLGGDSWVCSDNTTTWTFGLTSSRGMDHRLVVHTNSSFFTHTTGVKFAFAHDDSAAQPGFVVGFAVTSTKSSNGWWRRQFAFDTSLDNPTSPNQLTFKAQAPWMGSSSYEVSVWYVGREGSVLVSPA